ncbi:MAG TPA: hypothetical protein VGB88_06685 [Alphaproteobacteria bacterium]
MTERRAWALVALALLPAAAGAAEGRYAACVALAESAPAGALETAERWLAEGGDTDAARHCRALALVGVGRAGDAAAELTRLADGAEAPPAVRASLYEQAGNAWLLGGRADLAKAAFDRALALAPGAVEAHIDRARAEAALGDWWAAVEDLGRALDAEPARDDALALRASAWRRLEAWELAGDDVARALAVNPANADALLERAILALHAEQIDAARVDLGRVLMLAPGGVAASLARDYLAELDR